MNAPCLPILTRQIDQKIMIQIVVDERYTDLLRRTIICSCGDDISFVTAQPVPNSRAVRFWFNLSSCALVDTVMNAVMGALPEAEFGRYSYA
jgi:hypothetical protein